jgi:integrase
MAKRKEANLIEIDGKPYVRINYKDPRTGKWKSKYRRVQNARKVQEAAVDLRKKYGKPTPEQLDAEKMTFGDLLDAYPKPLAKWYVTLFRDWFGQMKLQAIDYAALQAFREHRLTVPHKTTLNKDVKKPRTVATINREMGALLRLFTFARKREWIPRNPFTQGDSLLPKAEETSRDRIPTAEEINRLLEHSTGPRRHLRVLIIAALDTGLRKGKLLTLKRPQIDLDNRLIDLGRPTVRNKKHPRFVGITERLAVELESWFDDYNPPDNEPVFGIKDDCKKAWATLCRLARVNDLHFHDLRHWHATNAIMAGLPKDLVMKQTGHTENATFDRYFNVDAEIAKAFARALDAHAGTNKGTHNS